MNLKLLLITFLDFLFTVTACPPPFNNFKFVGNETHDSAAIIQEALTDLAGAMGWAEVVSIQVNPHTVWPRGLVQYCYPEPEVRDKLHNYVDDAWKIWIDRIGLPSQQSGHRLWVREYEYKDKHWPYCYLKRDNPDASYVWNPEVPWDAVVLRWVTGDAYLFSSAGYIPSQWVNSWARHGIWVNKDKIQEQNIVKDLAHELGHIFGFWHEQQRIDREHYVHFECKNLFDYEKIKHVVETKPLDPKHNIELLCNDGNIAALYGWGTAAQYSIVYTIDPVDKDGKERRWVVNYDKHDYDENSIMHYNSWMNSDQSKDLSRKINVPLVTWEGTPVDPPPMEVTEENSDWLFRHTYPSDDDVRGVKYRYPW